MQLSPRAAPPRTRRGRRGRLRRASGVARAGAGRRRAWRPRRAAACRLPRPATARPGGAGARRARCWPGLSGARVALVQLVAVFAVFRPRFRREVRRFTSDLERGPDGAQGARTDAGGRGEAGRRRPPRVEPAYNPAISDLGSSQKFRTRFEWFGRCGFRVTVDYSQHRNTRIILSHSVAVRFALVGYCCARSSCSAGAQGASPRTAVRTAHALLAEWRAAFQGRPSLT